MSGTTEKQPTSLDLREIVAYQLMTDERDYDQWRRDTDIRAKFRALADTFLQELENAGLSVRVRSQAKLDKAIEELITIPASRAYELH